VVFLICGEVYLEDGYFTPNGLVCRNPFCLRDTTSSCSSSLYVLITYPQNNTVLYWSPPSITKNTTLSVYGTSLTTCEYNLGGTWNLFTHCNLGENNTWDIITYPEAYPDELTVRINNSCVSITNVSEVKVYGRPSAFTPYNMGSIVFPLVTILLLYTIIHGYRKRRTNSI
jgi:hypothetical protein